MNNDLHIEDVLKTQGVFVSTTVGVSMYPMLRDRRDTIVVRPLEQNERLKRFDIPLYRRGDKYVLHRIIKVLPNGYDILGDNCIEIEKNIPDNAVIGVLREYWRGDKKKSLSSFGYKLYVMVWYVTAPIRRNYKKLRAFFVRALRKLFKKSNKKQKR